MINKIKKFLVEHKKGFYAGIIVGIIVTLLNTTTDLKIISTILTISIIGGLLMDYIVTKKEKQSKPILYILSIIGGFYLLKQLQVVPLSSIPMQSVNLPTKAITGAFSKGGIIGAIGGIATLLFRFNPLIMIIFIGAMLLLIGVPFFTLSFTIIKNFNTILFIIGGISFILLILKFRK